MDEDLSEIVADFRIVSEKKVLAPERCLGCGSRRDLEVTQVQRRQGVVVGRTYRCLTCGWTVES